MTVEPTYTAPDDDPSTADEAANQARRMVQEGFAAAERALKEAVQTIRSQTEVYSGPASQTLDEAQRYLIERVKERPVTAAFAGLGVGLLVGLLLSSRGK